MAAAEALVELTREGAHAILDKDLPVITRSRRLVSDTYNHLFACVNRKEEYDNLRTELSLRQRNDNLTIYRDYLKRCLRAVRARFFRAKNSPGGLSAALSRDRTARIVFEEATWESISQAIIDEDRDERDFRLRNHAPPVPTTAMRNYVHAIAAQFCQYNGEMLVLIIHEYARRCQRTHSGFQPFVKNQNWDGLHKLFNKHLEELVTEFPRRANARGMLRHVMHQGNSNWYFQKSGRLVVIIIIVVVVVRHRPSLPTIIMH